MMAGKWYVGSSSIGVKKTSLLKQRKLYHLLTLRNYVNEERKNKLMEIEILLKAEKRIRPFGIS